MSRLVDLSVASAKQRPVQFERPIADFQAVQHMLADMAVDLDASRLMTYEGAWRLDEGLDVRGQSSRIKLFASEALGRVADRAVQGARRLRIRERVADRAAP